MIQKTTEKSALLQSGICSSDSSIKLGAGNTIVNLPFWKNLDGDDEILSDSTEMSVSKIETGKDIACVHLRGKSWSANDLASLLAGDKAMTAIGQKSADFWAKSLQKVLTSTLFGAFASESMAGSVVTPTGDEKLSANLMIDAMYALGDAYDSLTGVMMNSQTMAYLLKQDLIDYIPASEGKSAIANYMGKRVIVDDSLVEESGKMPIYFFGAGAIAFNEGHDIINVETDRDKLAGDDYLITRRQFTMHPRGIAWNPNDPEKPISTVTPTNNDLMNGLNWNLADARKNVAITKLLAPLA